MGNNGNINIDDFLTYKPLYMGIPCKPGDLLFSKINPRIPRLIVVPELGCPLTCSSEFEILNSKIEINNYGIQLLLMLPTVQAQINNLTSGTSSSHNRIKTSDLASVLVPLPKKNTKKYKELLNKSEDYLKHNKTSYDLIFKIANLKKDVISMFA